MHETVDYLFPFLIILVLINFVWAWTLTAVKSPPISGEDPIEVNPDWKYLDAGPEGTRKSIAQKIKPKIKTV